jgi:hypothetical protein
MLKCGINLEDILHKKQHELKTLQIQWQWLDL